MSRIEELVASAAATEGARIMQICNACRYCEGYCAVFPAMERRLDFDADSLAYLANLCHHCGACYYACQYAPPHEFAVNVPKTFAQIRLQSYEDYAWPPAFAAAYRRHGAVLAASLAAGISIFLLLALALAGRGGLFASHGASFYAVFPHGLMVSVFGAAFLFAIIAMSLGAARFRRALDRGQTTRPARRTSGLSPVRLFRSRISRVAGRVLRASRLRSSTREAAAVVPPLHFLWIPAVLRLDVARDRLSLRIRACARPMNGRPRW
jgi:citrate/tricarballylate utilization protein